MFSLSGVFASATVVWKCARMLTNQAAPRNCFSIACLLKKMFSSPNKYAVLYVAISQDGVFYGMSE
jgi:hypothetical protein